MLKSILIDSTLPVTCWHSWSFIVVLTAPKTNSFDLIWNSFFLFFCLWMQNSCIGRFQSTTLVQTAKQSQLLSNNVKTPTSQKAKLRNIVGGFRPLSRNGKLRSLHTTIKSGGRANTAPTHFIHMSTSKNKPSSLRPRLLLTGSSLITLLYRPTKTAILFIIPLL